MLTGWVTGTVGRVLAQTGTPVPQMGRVKFTPQVGDHAVDDTWILSNPVECVLDEQGRILDPTDPEGTRLGVELDASENVPGGFVYQVKITGEGFPSRWFNIVVEAGKSVDIATAVHVPPNPGQAVDRWADLVNTVQGWVDDPDALRGNPSDPGDPGVGVSGAEVTDTGRLIITLTSGQQIDAGRAWAPTRVYLDANRVPYVLTED